MQGNTVTFFNRTLQAGKVELVYQDALRSGTKDYVPVTYLLVRTAKGEVFHLYPRNVVGIVRWTSRKQFGELFQEHNRLGRGAEIGVQNGYNSQLIAKNWTGKILCVDNWVDPEIERTCKRVLSEIQGTCRQPNFEMIKADSVTAAAGVPDGSLDWVYIDAGHSYKEVKADFEAWMPKVRKGGIVSGHDYGDNDCQGVKQLIDEYMRDNPDVKMQFTTEDTWDGMEYQSWWFIVGEDARPC